MAKLRKPIKYIYTLRLAFLKAWQLPAVFFAKLIAEPPFNVLGCFRQQPISDTHITEFGYLHKPSFTLVGHNTGTDRRFTTTDIHYYSSRGTKLINPFYLWGFFNFRYREFTPCTKRHNVITPLYEIIRYCQKCYNNITYKTPSLAAGGLEPPRQFPANSFQSYRACLLHHAAFEVVGSATAKLQLPHNPLAKIIHDFVCLSIGKTTKSVFIFANNTTKGIRYAYMS